MTVITPPGRSVKQELQIIANHHIMKLKVLKKGGLIPQYLNIIDSLAPRWGILMLRNGSIIAFTNNDMKREVGDYKGRYLQQFMIIIGYDQYNLIRISTPMEGEMSWRTCTGDADESILIMWRKGAYFDMWLLYDKLLREG